MKFGEIEYESLMGGYEIVNVPASSLPQELATAISEVNSGLLGATYQPIWYVGKQIVNGTNYLLICKELRTTKDRQQMIVGLVVNLPIKKPAGGSGASIVEIIEEASLPQDVKYVFDVAAGQLLGVNYKPIVYVGKQVVRGINYYFICEAKRVVPNSKPYPVMLVVNKFQDQMPVVVSVEVIADDKNVNAPLGEWP